MPNKNEKVIIMKIVKWIMGASIPLPIACKAIALPFELITLSVSFCFVRYNISYSDQSNQVKASLPHTTIRPVVCPSPTLFKSLHLLQNLPEKRISSLQASTPSLDRKRAREKGHRSRNPLTGKHSFRPLP